MFLIILCNMPRMAINFPDFAMARFVLSTFSENVALEVPHLPWTSCCSIVNMRAYSHNATASSAV
jgi:hypothetical protein